MSIKFNSTKNHEILKELINNSLSEEYGSKTSLLWNNEYDKAIKETMNYVEGKVSKDILRTMNEEEYLFLMNKKVYNIIKPVIEENIKQDFMKTNNINKDKVYNTYDSYGKVGENNSRENEMMQKEYQRLKIEEQKNKDKKKITFNSENVNNIIRPGEDTNRDFINKQNRIDPQFDPELMKHYEKIPVIEYPQLSENDKIKESSLDSKMLDYNTIRNEINPRPNFKSSFETKKLEKEKDSVELMKSYNAKLKEYENQIMAINNFDEGQKKMNKNIENNLDRRKPYESLEENFFNNKEEDYNINNNNINDLLIGEYFQNKNNKNTKKEKKEKIEEPSEFLIHKDDNQEIILPKSIKTFEYNELKEKKEEPQKIYSDLFEKQTIPKRDNILMNEKNSLEKYNNNNSLDYSPFNNNQLTSVILPTRKESKTKKYRIILFSFFRNKKKYPLQTYFEVKFNPAGDSYVIDSYVDSNGVIIYNSKTLVYGDSNNANIPITFDNIKQIKIIDVTCPVIAGYIGGRAPVIYNGPTPLAGQIATGTFSQFNPIPTKSTGIPYSVYKEPSIYLYIPELEHSYYSTSDFGRKIFARLEPDYSSNDGFETIYTSRFTMLKPSDPDETYKYDPVLRGKLDKMTLSLYNYHGNLFNFGIDKLFIDYIEKGELRYGGYCGKEYYTTKIYIKKTDSSYADYCRIYGIETKNCDTLTSHPVAPGDLIYFYNTQPLINNYIYLENYIKVTNLDITNVSQYIVLYAGYTREEVDPENPNNKLKKEYNVIFKDFIPGGNINSSEIYNDYSIVLRVKKDGHIGLKNYVMNILGFEKDGGIRLEYIQSVADITDLNKIEQIAWVQNNDEGSNSEEKTSLFYKQGFNVIRVGDFNNISQLETEDVDQFLIEIDYPFENLPDNLNPLNKENNFSSGDIFFIQEKLQINYLFEIETEIIDSSKLTSNIQGSGLNF